jgi:hypothetical protein
MGRSCPPTPLFGKPAILDTNPTDQKYLINFRELESRIHLKALKPTIVLFSYSLKPIALMMLKKYGGIYGYTLFSIRLNLGFAMCP